MRNKQKISSYFLLLVFLVTLIHSAIPHMHHSHISTDDAVALTKHGGHHHHDDHHHHHDDVEESHSLFDFLSSHHVHSEHAQELIVLDSQESESVDHTSQVAILAAEINFLSSIIDSEVTHFVKTSQQLHFQDTYLLSNPLRGPPLFV